MRDVYVFLHGFFMALAFLAFYAMADRVRAMRPVLCYHGTKTLLIMMMLGLTVITVRDSVNLKIWSYIGSDPAGTYAVKTDGLSGWMSDPVRGEALDNMAAFINSSVPAGDRILVLSDMQILYALTGRPSYPHIPLIQLQENHAPPPGRQQEKVTDYIHEHKPDWLVVDILSYLRVIPYMGLSEMINQEYTIVSTSGPYAILQHLN